MSYHVVFDVADAGYKSWSFPAHGLVMIIVGAFLVAARKNLPGEWWKNRPRASAAFAFFFLGFAVLWTSVSFIATYRDFAKASTAQKEGRARVVEGLVTDFKSMPKRESFCVQSQCFQYSDYIITAGFNNMSSHGGPIKAGLPVRITYSGNTILKLEVAQ